MISAYLTEDAKADFVEEVIMIISDRIGFENCLDMSVEDITTQVMREI